MARIGDLFAVTPAINGKIELVYEGEREGPEKVAQHLLDMALRNVFLGLFPDPEKARKQARADAKGRAKADPYAPIIAFFDEQHLELMLQASDQLYRDTLDQVTGLRDLVITDHPYLPADEVPLWMEFVLHGLAEKSRIGRSTLVDAVRFTDVMGSVLMGEEDEEDSAEE